MLVTYDPEVDGWRLLFSNAPIEASGEDKPVVVIDYDKDVNSVGLEMLDASQRMDSPAGGGLRGAGLGNEHVRQ
jgi:uncharacterized protein YuzE